MFLSAKESDDGLKKEHQKALDSYKNALSASSHREFLPDVSLTFVPKNMKEVETMIRNNDAPVFDENGQLIVYDLDVKKQDFLRSARGRKFGKQFVALHGTGASEKSSDISVNMAGFSTLLYQEKNGKRVLDPKAAFMVCKNGMLIRFFKEQLGTGAIGAIPHEKTLNSMNSLTIGIEAVSRSVYNDAGRLVGVEPLTPEQQKTIYHLHSYLSKTYSIPSEHFITSADPVRDEQGRFYKGAHIDDFSNEDRFSVGIPSKEANTHAMNLFRVFGKDSIENVTLITQVAQEFKAEKEASEDIRKIAMERRIKERLDLIKESISFTEVEMGFVAEQLFLLRDDIAKASLETEWNFDDIVDVFQSQGIHLSGIMFDHHGENLIVMSQDPKLGDIHFLVQENQAKVQFSYQGSDHTKLFFSKEQAISKLALFFLDRKKEKSDS